jgi:hypothetical protein
MTTDTERLIARLEEPIDEKSISALVEYYDQERREAAAALRVMQTEKRELALDVIAASGQAQEAYKAQLAAEAKLSEVKAARDKAEKLTNALICLSG